MSPKFLITVGLIVGSTLGGMAPSLWGDSSGLSITSAFLALIGGAIGVWAGYKLAKIMN